MEKDFPISNYPLEQTEFLFDSKQGKVDCSDLSCISRDFSSRFSWKSTKKHAINSWMKKIRNSITQCFIIGRVFIQEFVLWKSDLTKKYGIVIKPDESVVRLFFDILHGIDRADIPLVVALEFAILLGYDGQLKQNSDMEMELFQSTIDQLKKTKMTKTENALMWLYVKTWGLQGQHVIEKDDIWNFGGAGRV